LRPVTVLAAFDLYEFRDLLAGVAQEIAPHGFALCLDAQPVLALLRGRDA
jgi:hypothetical protein